MAEIDDIFASKGKGRAVISTSVPPDQKPKASKKRKRVVDLPAMNQSGTVPETVFDSSTASTHAKRPKFMKAAKDAAIKDSATGKKKMKCDAESKFQDSRGSESRQSSIPIFCSLYLQKHYQAVKRRKAGRSIKKMNWAYMTGEAVSTSRYLPFLLLISEDLDTPLCPFDCECCMNSLYASRFLAKINCRFLTFLRFPLVQQAGTLNHDIYTGSKHHVTNRIVDDLTQGLYAVIYCQLGLSGFPLSRVLVISE